MKILRKKLAGDDYNNYKFLSGGNFHGQIIGFQASKLKVMMSEYGSVSERRLSRLLDPTLSRGLPSMLVKNAGLNSGYMIAQYTSASLALKNVNLSNPSVVKSLPTCANQEDHNSNSWNEVLELDELLRNLECILVLELISNVRALELRCMNENMNLNTDLMASSTRTYFNMLYKCLTPTMNDHFIGTEIDDCKRLIRDENFYVPIDNLINSTLKTSDNSEDNKNLSSIQLHTKMGRNISLGICESVKSETNKATLTTPSGMVDCKPEDMIVRNRLYDIATNVFKAHGAVQIKTPMFEKKEILTGKYGDAEKLIFELNDQGGAKLCVRYDNTVPLARYVNQYNCKTLKRYVIADVCRRDNPSIAQGRLREFTQMDFDIVGNFDLMVADADGICSLCEIFDQILYSDTPEGAKEYNYVVKYNDRRIHDFLLKINGVDTSNSKMINSFWSSIDKLDKMEFNEVRDELILKGFDVNTINKIGEFVCMKGMPHEVLNFLRDKFNNMFQTQVINAQEDYEFICDVLGQIELLFNYLKSYSCLDRISFDLSLARGLDYYTSSVIEAVCTDETLGVGSIAGGGRYDNLIGKMFGSQNKVPAFGFAVGVDRVLAILKLKMGIGSGVPISNTKCYITYIPKRDKNNTSNSDSNALFSQQMYLRVLECATRLRNNKINTDIVMKSSSSLKEQIKYCEDVGIPIMLIIGETEFNDNMIQVKVLGQNGMRINVSQNELVSSIQNLLA